MGIRAALTLRTLLRAGSRTFTSRASANQTTRTSILVDTNSHRSSLLANQQQNKIRPVEFQCRFEATSAAFASTMNVSRDLERSFTHFELRAQRSERVIERDYVKTFDKFTKATQKHSSPQDINNISLYMAILLRSCGSLMLDTPPKGRELLADNLWTFIKENNLPIDISHYNSLIKILNENGTNFDPTTMLEEIKAANLTPDRITYQRLIERSCIQGDIQGATKLLEEMKNLNMELSENIFASLIVGYGKQASPPAVTEMFDLMRQNNIEPGNKSYAAAFISLAPRLDKDPNAVSLFEKVYELYKNDDILLSLSERSDLITHLLPFKGSHNLVANLLEETMLVTQASVNYRYRMLSILTKANHYEEAAESFWSMRVNERNIEIGNAGSYWIQLLAGHYNVPLEFIEKECQKLLDKGYNRKPYHVLYLASAQSGRLDACRLALKHIAEEEPVKIQYYWPLIAQAKDENEVIEFLKNDLRPDMRDLIETFSSWVWPKFSHDVNKLFELNKDLKYDNNLLLVSFLNYSVQENKVMEAIKFISEAPQELVGERSTGEAGTNEDENDNDGQVRIDSRLKVIDGRSNLVERLLQQVALNTGNPELVKKAFYMSVVPDQKMSSMAMRPLVDVYLAKGDFDGALTEFFSLARDYRVTPCRMELMTHCLVNKDPENLQKVMNVTTEIHGENNSLFDLAVCCLQTGKLKQAQKIFASPGFRVRPTRVYRTCRGLARQNDLGALENFVNLTRYMYDVNQELLYQVLLDVYDRTSNAKRALNLWHMMQEEEFQPSKGSLIMIADILEKNGIEVPFKKPSYSADEEARMRQIWSDMPGDLRRGQQM